MDLSENLSNSFGYAKKLVKDVGRWILLIILNVIPIVNFIAVGYMAKVLEETPNSNEPPKLENYGGLWIQGLKVIVLSFIYMIIPVVLFMLGFLTSFRYPFTAIGLGLTKVMVRGVLLIVGAVIIAFFIAIIYVMALAHMIKNKSFVKGFALNEILSIIKCVGLGKYILWIIALFIIGLIVAAVNSIPYIGWLISIVISPLYMVFLGRSIGLTYNEGAVKAGLMIQPPTTTEAKNIKYCIQCGAEIPIEAAFCQKCGAAQEAI
ncbi:DUF4013 domain-containing protein [Candidatus Bathyarchaeota archaeon]|nr:DUF4013 domain-containing protein [Candidatus Bathyarchaeota archaeon]